MFFDQYRLQNFWEAGLINQWKAEHKQASKATKASVKAAAKGVNIKDTQGAFMIASIMIIAAFIAFCLEYIVYRTTPQQQIYRHHDH